MTSLGDQTDSLICYCPTSKSDLYALMTKYKNDKIRLVAGNTGKGMCMYF